MSIPQRWRRPLALTAILILLVYIVWLQLQLIALEADLAALRGEISALQARATNLEYIVNAHSDHLREHDKQIYTLRLHQADLDWRASTARWDIDAARGK